MITVSVENTLLDTIGKHFVHPPSQLNAQHESDAELLCVEGDDRTVLAITTDTIIEEITEGLYDDPYIAGWMIVMVNLSDLAAVGATPLGVLVAETLPENCSEEFIAALQRGIADACRTCGTYVLGGDTNFADRFMLGGTALGRISGKPLTRIGCRPGDILFSSGLIGSGNGFVLHKMLHRNGQNAFKPVARIAEGRCIAAHATACMDTSDGILATLDQLMYLNQTGFSLEKEWPKSLDPGSSGIVRAFSIPEWLLLAGNHGEYELLFTVPPERMQAFLADADQLGWAPWRIGTVVPEQRISLMIDGTEYVPDTGYIRNIFAMRPFTLDGCIKMLLEYDRNLRMEG